MRKLAAAVLFLFIMNLTASGQNPVATPSASLAYVFDPSQQSVTAIDLSSGKKVAEAIIAGSRDTKRDSLALAPDASRLVMMMDGLGGKDFLREHKQATQATVTVFDAKTMKPFQPIDIGYRLNNDSITPDSKVLITVSSGIDIASSYLKSISAAKYLPGEIVTTDLSSGRETGRIPIPREVTESLISKDGKTVILFFEKQKKSGSPAELQFISLEKKAVAGKVTFEGNPEMPFFSPSGEFIYLLDKGTPSNKPRKNIDGKIQAVSFKEMKVEAVLDAGSNPRIAMPDDQHGQTLILSDGAPVPNPNQLVDAEVRVLRGTSIAAVMNVANGPKYLDFSSNSKLLFITSTFDIHKHPRVINADYRYNDPNQDSADHYDETAFVGFDQLTVIDYSSLKVLGQIPLNGAVSTILSTPDGSRGFALKPKTGQVLPLDLPALKPGALVATGRNEVKTAHFVVRSIEGGISMLVPLASAVLSSADSFIYSPTNPLMFMRTEGDFIYVLNQGTSDVTIVNTKDLSVVNKIGGGGRSIEPLQGGGVLAVVDFDSIHRIDTSSQKALPEVHFKNKLLDLSLSPDGHTAVALVEDAVVILDGATGEIRSRIEGFNRPLKILYAQPDLSK